MAALPIFTSKRALPHSRALRNDFWLRTPVQPVFGRHIDTVEREVVAEWYWQIKGALGKGVKYTSLRWITASSLVPRLPPRSPCY